MDLVTVKDQEMVTVKALDLVMVVRDLDLVMAKVLDLVPIAGRAAMTGDI